ncbi:hypothetical protein OC861_003872 [Tilletia horrida]|nr:hypothetical protein OC861_003872 [Tilletia horrida]
MAAARSILSAAATASARRSASSVSSSSAPLLSAAATQQRPFSTSQRAQSDKDPQLGDYPDLPNVSLQRRRWSPNWWDGQEKRNFGETLHEEHDAMSVWAPDAAPIPPSSALFQFSIAALAMSAFAGLVYLTKFETPAVRRSYGRDGLKAELGNTEYPARSSEAEEANEAEAEDAEEEDSE